MNFKEIKEKELASKTEKVASELKTLKAQLNLHFLFNTLNNIYVLSLDNLTKTTESIEKLPKILDHVLFRCNTKHVSLSSEIELLENNTSIISKSKLGVMEQELSVYQFLRIHRSYIINTSKITAFTSNDIDVDTQEITVGASYKEAVILFLEQIKK